MDPLSRSPRGSSSLLGPSWLVGIAATAALSGSAVAQAPAAPPPNAPATGRSQENVVRQAEDGFGATVGRESLGIYSAGNVRGFSALAAGNARIDGLFFDQVASPGSRIRRSTTIRVGLSSLSFPFPAPTGVVDYALAKPEAATSGSATLAGDAYGAAGLDFDVVLPLAGERLVVAGGAGISRGEYVNGASDRQVMAGVTALIRPTPATEIQPFWSRTNSYDSTLGPLYAPIGGALPPDIPARRFLGQPWAVFEGASQAYGLLAKIRPRAGWTIDAGLFRSEFLTDRDTFVLLSGIGPDGRGRYSVVTDPPGQTGSTSGEVRLGRTVVEGPRTHRLIASIRGRDRRQLFGGSDEQDLGEVAVGEVIRVPEPGYRFGEQSRDHVRQRTGGVAYAGRWSGLGEISLGLSRTDYRKRVRRPGAVEAATASRPWLYNGAAAVLVQPRLTVYGGFARGLEESGVAPQSATNRNEALPAILTSQRDLGLRWAATDRLRLIAGVFDLRKPYFSRDATGLFTRLGNIRSRGVEISLSGQPTPDLRLVLGGALLDPEVTGEAVALGRVGPRPVGLPKVRMDFNAEWTTPIKPLSLDLRLTHRGRRPATTSNNVRLPARTVVDLGARYRFKIAKSDATLRVSLSNVFDEKGFELFGSGAYDIAARRLLSAYLAADF